MEGAFSESGPYHGAWSSTRWHPAPIARVRPALQLLFNPTAVIEFTNPPTLELNPYTWNNATNNLCDVHLRCASLIVAPRAHHHLFTVASSKHPLALAFRCAGLVEHHSPLRCNHLTCLKFS